jgi:predicted DNA-binding antitoxin AbrB/MazE fold protein
MLQTVWAVVSQGTVKPVDNISLPEGAKVMVTILTEEDESRFWLLAGESPLTKVWGNLEDDIYAELLQQ